MTAPWLVLGLLACGVALGFALGWSRRELARAQRRLEAAGEELQRLQHAFARFAPEAIVERIASAGVPTSGERKEVTVLFADLVGFTATSEGLDPAVLVEVLNGYFERMSRAITAHQGHLSTLIGDGILALFGALEANPWHSGDALRAAQAMREALADYNRELAARSLPALAMGIGLHRGVGVAGLVGSRDMMQFTVVGTVVNVAARVQGLTRIYGVDVLLTREVKAALDPGLELRALPPSRLRGVSEPVLPFALGDAAPSTPQDHYSV